MHVDYSQHLNQNLDFFQFQTLVFKNHKQSDLQGTSLSGRGEIVIGKY